MGPTSLLAGFALGLSLAIPPGPINALIAREASQRGAAAAIRVGVAAPIADTLYMVAVVFGLPLLVDVGPYLPALALLGAVLMGYLAWATSRPPPSRPEAASARPGAAFLAVFALSMANPVQIGWWLTAGTAFLGEQGLLGMLGFLAAIFTWVVAFSEGMARGARRWEGLEPLVAVASADLLLAFAFLLLRQAAAGWSGL
ncbi:MAG: LysE family transporter [Halobacteriales archaeon]|nr:LysE family transporter [Halobacteriales archaeon]